MIRLTTHLSFGVHRAAFRDPPPPLKTRTVVRCTPKGIHMNLPVWSFTNLNDYATCPKRFFHKHVAKDCPVEVKSQAQADGIAVHDALKKRIKLREPLPVQLAHHELICAVIDADPGVKHVEMALGMTHGGAPCDFFAKNVFLRGRVDLAITRQAACGPASVLVDWKTGKPWEDPTELRYQALLLRAAMPELAQITGFYVWLRTNAIGQMHDVNDTARTWADVHRTLGSIVRRFNAADWPADDGPLCAWCPVGKDQCQHKRDPQ